MTTTELYSGYGGDGKPSSRVLRPPGGASSNIFGGPEAPAAPAPKEQMRQEMAQQSPAAAQTQSPGNPTAEANEGYQKNKPKGRVQYNPITGEEYPADYGQQNKEEEEEQEKDETEESEKDSNESNNTSTDVDNSTPQKTEPSPAPVVQPQPEVFKKVRQPPGGKSSGLW